MEIIVGIIAASFGVAIALFMTSRSSKSNRESNEQLMSGLMGQAMVELREAARNANSIAESLRLHAEACVLEERLIHTDR